MILVCKRFKFDAAHFLPKHKGKCKNLHGHRFWLDVEITGKVHEKGSQKGMIMDFSLLKEIVESAVINQVDHTCLNDNFINPTAEMMVIWFSNWIKESLSMVTKKRPVTLTRLRLYETEDSYAEWRNDENTSNK